VRARLLIALALAALLAGCQESGFDESRETQRPLKVQHALDMLTGTKVPGVAERPMALSVDALGDTLALGVEPVRAALPGGELPGFLRSDAAGVEIVAPLTELDLAATEAADPDVILGVARDYRDMYKELSRIAPTVMSDGENWKLDLRLHGEALGRTNDAEQLLIDWDDRVARVKEAVGERDVSVVLSARDGELETGPTSFAGSILADAGVEPGSGGDVVLRIQGGPEWSGGGLMAARAALAALEREL
jgi:iron complex transport system substrate-binding protein